MSQSNIHRAQKISLKSTKKALVKLSVRIDNIQQNNKFLSFLYALQKKYSQDQAGNLGALITYYGLLTFFPLLSAVLSITQLSVLHSAHLKSKVLLALNNYLPIIGHQLQTTVHAEQKAGVALVVSVVIVLYGSRGAVNALQMALNNIWHIPKAMRVGFPKNIISSLVILLAIGGGLIITGLLSSYVVAHTDSFYVRILAFISSLLITFIVLMFVFKLSISKYGRFKEFIYGSIFAAFILQIIQLLGGLIVVHEFKHLSSFYGSLALVFILLFWIYLQIRVVLYAAEINTIIKFKLSPRSLSGLQLTAADRRINKAAYESEVFQSSKNLKI